MFDVAKLPESEEGGLQYCCNMCLEPVEEVIHDPVIGEYVCKKCLTDLLPRVERNQRVINEAQFTVAMV